jgi:2-aminoadipate transaminase
MLASPQAPAAAGARGGSLPVAAWVRESRPSALQTLLARASGPDLISFALGLPAPELFPAEAVRSAADRVLRHDPLALQYAPPSGRLRAQVAELMARRGVECSPEQVFLTAGAQQGMSLVARALVDPGATVVTESLTYTGFRQALEPLRARILTVPTDPGTGMDVDALEALLGAGHRPALIYAIPQGHNPTGASMPLERRIRLVELARTYGVPVVEDDAYGFLQYRAELPPPLRAIDPAWVCYVGSFSKILAPGLRQGWVVVPEDLVPALANAKEASDINTATLAQRTLSSLLEAGTLRAHVAGLCATYRARRDAMTAALETHFPPGTRWALPESGVFLWVELPHGLDATVVLRHALEREGVAFVPGAAFATRDGEADHCMRLNFSHPSLDRIAEGVARLARAVERARTPPHGSVRPYRVRTPIGQEGTP